jgi:hypothetical protein
MTRLELLTIVIGRARSNGFEFRRWYATRLGLPWIDADSALACVEQQRRYYALLFSHEFAIAFWKSGEDITFQVPAQTFQRKGADGTIQTVTRKTFTRRSARKDAWRYHLREMALAEEPLRYIRRYLNVEEDLVDEPPSSSADSAPKPSAVSAKRAKPKPAAKPPRALPKELPAFLRRPYHP